ncbi:MAG: TPM domain-containing protein [Pseudobdellovibrionaceae bacterium]
MVDITVAAAVVLVVALAAAAAVGLAAAVASVVEVLLAAGKTWIHKYLSEEDIKQITVCVQKNELTTVAEIVPVIVRKSSATGHVPVVLSLLVVLIVMLLEAPYAEHLWVYPWIFLWIPLLLIVYVLSLFLGQIPAVARVFISEKDEWQQVHQRAELEFYRNGLEHTLRRSGVLIFVSELEHKAVILVDQGIAARLPASTWDPLIQELLKSLRQGQWALGFQNVVQSCGQILTAHFPSTEATANDNELGNQLIIKDN